MTEITKTINDLIPNTTHPNNKNCQASWFSHVRKLSSNYYEGTIEPPTKAPFVNEWSKLDSSFIFTCIGKTFEECKKSLENCSLPEIKAPFIVGFKKIRTITWTRMILALNMYAAVRRQFNCLPCNNVDFIGSAGDDQFLRDTWEPRFHDRCVLFLSDSKLRHMIELIETNRTKDFWRCIFDIYEDLDLNNRFNHI
jgi:hypothetical protein